MPLDPNIILQIGRDNRSRAEGQRQERGLQLQERQYNDAAPQRQAQQQMSQEQIAAQKLQNMSARDQRRLQSSLEGLSVVDGLARQYEDPQQQREAITGYLNNRLQGLQRRQSAGEDVDANETLEALTAINKPGGFESFRKQAAAQVEAARGMGLLKTQSVAGQPGGATGYIVERLMNENPNLSYGDALAQVQTGYRQGVTFNDGAATPIPGMAQSRGAIKYGETAGGEQAKAQYADDIAFQREQGKQDAADIGKLPGDIGQIQLAVGQIDRLLQMPGLDSATGLSSLLPTIPGTDKADFKAALDQLKGGAFLQARQALKGGGAISDTESNKAEQSVARMQTTQSEEEFIRSMNDFRTALRDGLQKIKEKSGQIEARRGNGGVNSPQGGRVFLSDESGYEAPLPPRDGEQGAPQRQNNPVFEVDF